MATADNIESCPFSLDSLRTFGLSDAIDFVQGKAAQPKDFNLEGKIDDLIAYLNHVNKTPYYHLGSEQGGLYMERDWLIPKSEDKPAARVHRIHRSDLDRAAHNHPWNHFSVILEHGYYELVPSPNGQEDFSAIPEEMHWLIGSEEPLFAIRRRKGDVVFRTPEMRHKLVVLSDDQKPLTLFVTAPKSKDWGFFTKEGFVIHTQYLKADVQELSQTTQNQQT